ncbi:MAG: pantoate--beta-alanine ligase [Verrucomicrobiota bacterium]
MQIIHEIETLRALIRKERGAGPVVLVPTMGALHAGHGALVGKGRERAGKNGMVVVSVFVNPTQFGPDEDFEAYPRTLEADAQLSAEFGGDVIFAPAAGEIYQSDHSTGVIETRLSKGLCGRSRPGHFEGVCQVVLKLLLIVQPDQAVFGKKDFQQLAVIRRMVRDLNVPVGIVGFETVREPDGLAMSSRNRYLSEEERAVAPGIQKALQAGRAASLQDPSLSPEAVRTLILRELEALEGGQVDYLELVDAETLEPIEDFSRPVVAATAVFFGRARLIDNVDWAV